MKKIRIGIIGYGGICQGVHLPGYKTIADKAEITAVCDIDKAKLEKAKQDLNLSDNQLFEHYEDLLDSGLVDAVDICTPNNVHCPIATAAIDRGIRISVEKPLGCHLKEAEELEAYANKKDIASFICFSWRYNQNVRYIRDLIIHGELGKLYHIYVRCIKDSGLWEGRKLEWRFDKEQAGSGVLGDLGSHMIDIVRFMGEEIASVYAETGIVVKERPNLTDGKIEPVTTDDWANLNLLSTNGVPVTISLSRVATTLSQIMEIEIYGEKGTITFHGGDGGYKITGCVGGVAMDGKARYELKPPAKYAANQSLSFVNMLNGIEDEFTAHLCQGVACQKVLEAAQLSAETGKRVNIADLK